MTPWEKYGGTASSSALDLRLRWPGAAAAEEVGQRERRAQLGLAAAALGAVAEALEQVALVARHPAHDRRVGELVARGPRRRSRRRRRSTLQRLRGRCSAARSCGTSFCTSDSTWVCVSSDPADRGDRQRRRRARGRGRGASPRASAPRAPRPRRAAARGARARRGCRPPARPRRATAARQRRAAARRGRAPRRAGARASASAAVPSVSAHTSATAMPATSSRPKPRTIGTGESASTRKPARRRGRGGRRPSARRARPRGRPPRAGSPAAPPPPRHPRLQLDRVVDREADEHRQHADRGHRQRRADQRQRRRR